MYKRWRWQYITFFICVIGFIQCAFTSFWYIGRIVRGHAVRPSVDAEWQVINLTMTLWRCGIAHLSWNVAERCWHLGGLESPRSRWHWPRFWPITLTFESDMDWVNINQHTKCLGHRLFILPTKVRECVFTGVGLCVCLCVCVCLSVTTITK